MIIPILPKYHGIISAFMNLPTCRKAIIFLFCFLLMTARHWTLESWSMVSFTQAKTLTRHSLQFSGTALGLLDTTYLLSYAVGCYVSGVLGDRYSRVAVATVGVLLACGALGLAISAGFWGFASLPLFVGLFIGNGLGQATVWPGTVAIMGNWFAKENRGTVFGWWSTSTSVGNIIGAQFAGILISLHATWELIMLIAISGLLLSLFLFTAFVSEKPLSTPLSTESMLTEPSPADSSAVSFLEAWKLPG